MTSYTMDDLERLAVTEDVGALGDVTSQNGAYEDVTSQNSAYPPLPDFRVNVHAEIVNFVISFGRAVSRAEIAQGISRKKSSWLVEKIEDCVNDGRLIRHQTYWKNGVVMFYYFPAAD